MFFVRNSMVKNHENYHILIIYDNIINFQLFQTHNNVFSKKSSKTVVVTLKNNIVLLFIKEIPTLVLTRAACIVCA